MRTSAQGFLSRLRCAESDHRLNPFEDEPGEIELIGALPAAAQFFSCSHTGRRLPTTMSKRRRFEARWTRAGAAALVLALSTAAMIGVVGAPEAPGPATPGANGANGATGSTKLVILHTNDIQSRLLGYGPNAEYSPLTTGDDATIGGFARLVTLVEERRAAARRAGAEVLLLDGGDITMGTLFHTVTRETGGELRLMALAGYDAAAVGNHEFDFHPDGLARMIRSALAKTKSVPPLLMSNLDFDPKDPRDDSLEALMKEGAVKRHLVLQRGKLRIGLFGLLGYDGFESTKTAAPLSFKDPIETAKKMVKLLREQEKVNVVIVCSHSGVRGKDGNWTGEDVELAAVPGIDVVVGGHSHTLVEKPRFVNGRVPVLQAGSELRALGELTLEVTGSSVKPGQYVLHKIDDRTKGDKRAIGLIDELKREVTRLVLSKHGLRFDQVIAETPRELTRRYDDHVLGNITADAIRIAARTDIGITTNGVIRDDVLVGKTGVQRISDIFRIAPLGVGETDGEPGNTLAKIYVNGKELKAILEVLSFAYVVKGNSYYPRLSGIRFYHNPLRVPLDRVYRAEIITGAGGPHPIDLKDETRLYSVAATNYVMKFMSLIKKLSFGLRTVTPKNAQGQPVSEVKDMVIDADPKKPGIQELKEWAAIIAHVSSFPDTNGNGIPDFPVTGDIAQARMVRSPGITTLFTNADYTRLYLILLLPIGWYVTRRLRGRSKTQG